MSRRLEVLLHGRVAGYFSETPDGGSEFRPLDSYRDLVPRPVLGQKFEDDLERIHRSRKGRRLPDFFANLVPEGRLREVIEDTAGIEAGDELALLAFVGRDLPGAVVVRPAGGEEAGFPEGPQDPDLPPAAAPATASDALRFSLAGVQLKFSMLRDAEKLTLPARDRTGEWIVKFDSPTWPRLPENEYAMLEWARRAGFDVPECHLHDVDQVEGFPRRFAPDGTRVLAIRRYDREGSKRIHQEDFAQAVGLPPHKKYDQITHEAMARLAGRFIDGEAVEELVRRLVFIIASGNNDAHLKNWSLVYPDAVQARWSPLYDQVATVAWSGPDRSLALKLAGVKEFSRIGTSTLERFADKAGLARERVLGVARDTLERLRQTWREVGSDLPLPADHARALRRQWERVPLLRDAGELA